MSIPIFLIYIFEVDTLHLKGLIYGFLTNLNFVFILVFGVVIKVKLLLIVATATVAIPLFFYQHGFKKLNMSKIRVLTLLFAAMLMSYGNQRYTSALHFFLTFFFCFM